MATGCPLPTLDLKWKEFAQSEQIEISIISIVSPPYLHHLLALYRRGMQSVMLKTNHGEIGKIARKLIKTKGTFPSFNAFLDRYIVTIVKRNMTGFNL